MHISSENRDLFDFLREEFESRGVSLLEASPSVNLVLDWSISRDEFGFVIAFPLEYTAQACSFMTGVFGEARFGNAEEFPVIHRDDQACVTVMTAIDEGAGQLILVHGKSAEIKAKIADQVFDAIEATLNDAVVDVCETTNRAIEAVGSPNEDAVWIEATEKIDDLQKALATLKTA